MANDKKFIVKNGLLTPENAVIGSNTDTGEKLQVTGDTVLTQSTAGTPTLKVTNSGGNSAIIGQFEGDASALQVKNLTTGDYQLVNTGNNNGIIFYNDTGGVSIQYNGGDRLVISNSGNEFSGLSNTTIDGNRILTTADEGAGNGLDADTVDGLEAAQFVRADVDDIMAGSYTIQNNLIISGDLTVSGNTTTVNTEEILLADNIITINSNYTGSSPTEDGGIEVERGTLANAKVIWNESQDYWQLEVNNAVLGRIITTADEGPGNGFDADTVDGLEAAQFLRSDADDTATGNITIEGDLTIGDNAGPAQIFFDGQNNNRTLYSNNGEIGFLNTAANWAMKSDADGDLEVERDVEAGRDVTADRNVVADGNVTATTGNVSATAGDVTAGDDVIAQNNVTATTGNVAATAGNVTAGQDVTAGDDMIAQNNITATTGNITASAGNIAATVGDVTAGDDVIAQNNVTATSGDVTAGNDVIAQNDITATTGNISASAGSVSAATTVTAGTDVIGKRFVDADNNSRYMDPATGGNVQGVWNWNNGTISNLNNLTFNDPGPNEGIQWIGGSDWRIYESPNDLTTNAGGNLQFVTGTTWRFRMETDGDFFAAKDINAGGNVSGVGGIFTGDVTAARFVDADNNSYFADPNSTSVMNRIGIDDYIQHNGDTDTYFGFNANDNFKIFTAGAERLEVNGTYLTSAVDGIFPNLYAGRYYDSSNATYYGDFASTSRVNDISLVGEIIHDGDTDTYIHFPAANQFEAVIGGNQRFFVNGTYALATNQMRSPIYYDNDNTTYYGNFAGTSVMSSINIDSYIRHNGDTDTYLGFSAADTIDFYAAGSHRARINNTVSTFYSDIQANRFVDRNNTAYYVNPGDATLAATLNGSVRIANIADSARYDDTSGTGGIVLAGDADIAANQSTMMAISGQYRSGAFALMYLNRIDANVNPFDGGNRYIEFRADGVNGGAAFRGDSSGNFYLTPQASQNIGFWTSGGNEVAVALDDGNFVVGGSSVTYTVGDNTPVVGAALTNNKLHVNGSIQLTSNDDAIVIGRGTATFLKDEELGFGWGGGWYMLDGTYIRARNNKHIYTTGSYYGNVFYSYQNTAYYADPDGDSQFNTVDIDDYVRHRGDTNTYMGFNANDQIQFVTNASNRFQITNSTVRARNKFEVYGSGIELQKQSNGGGVGITITDQNSGELPGLSGLQQASMKVWHADSSVTSGANLAVVWESSEPTTHYVFSTNNNAAGGNVIPRVTNTGSLGLTSYRWATIYAQSGDFSSNVTGNNAYFYRYYDRDDNAYYADPNGTSIFRGLTLNNPAGDTVLKFGPGLPGNDDAHIEWKGTNNAGYLRFSTADDSDAGSNEHMEFGDYAGTGRGGAFYRWARMQRAYLQHDASMRSPYFYASDNTAYYVDPNGDSQLNTIDIDDYIRHRSDTNTYIGFAANDTFRVWTGGTQRVNIDNNSADFAVNVYAPRYYDSNATSRYIEPGGGGILQGNFEFAPSSTATGYSTAAIELRESNYTGNATATPPRLGFHWGGVVASNIAIEANGTIAIRNNPGTGYEKFRASQVTADIYYDANNTARYMDPASRSQINAMTINDGNDLQFETSGNNIRGYIQATDTNDAHLKIATSGGEDIAFYDGGLSGTRNFLIRGDGDTFTTRNTYAQIFYDSQDSSFRVDPNGISVLSRLDTDVGLVSGTNYSLHPYYLGQVLFSGGHAGQGGSTFDVARHKNARLYGRNGSTWTDLGNCDGILDGWVSQQWGGLTLSRTYQEFVIYFGSTMGYSFCNGVAITHSTNGNNFDIYVESKESVTNPWESGFTLHSSRTGQSSWPGGTVITDNFAIGGGYNNNFRLRIVPNWTHASNSISFGSIQIFAAYGSPSRSYYTDFSRNLIADVSMRAPIFYDNNNTGYYVDPASNSRFNTTQALRYYMNHGTTYYMDEASGNYGSVEVGGRRSGWAGYSIEGNYVFMSNTSNMGLFNDIDNEWMLYGTRNAGLDLYYNNVKQAETENGYFLATNQMRAPIYYDSSNTSYYLDPAAGNTSNALRIAGRIRRDNFDTSSNGDNNRFLEAQDYSHWIWNTANNWGIFWAGNNNAAYSHFSTSNPNEIVFVGAGNVRASIDLDNGNAHFNGVVSAGSFALNGGNENIELIKSYGSGGADLVLFDGTEYFDKRVIKAMAPNESPLTGTTSEFVRTTDGPFAGSMVLQSSAYRTFYSDYIPVVPGEDLYGEISVKRISGSGGLLYYGIERFDSQKRPIAGNTGTTYFVVGGANYTGTTWNTYRGHTTIPTSHTPYGGSDGGGCYYVRIRILMNYNSGGALRQWAGIMLKRRNAESNLLVDDLLADDITADEITANIFRDRAAPTTYYVDPASISYFNDIRPNIMYDRNNTSYYINPASTSYWNTSQQNGYHTFLNYGIGITGTYTSTRLQQVFAMGSSYRLPADGNSTANMYGIAWSHPNAGSKGGANNLNDHGMLIINNGSFRAAISSRAVFSQDVRGTLFYDYNNTGYYVDPASTSRMVHMRLSSGDSYLKIGANSATTTTRDTNRPQLEIGENHAYPHLTLWSYGTNTTHGGVISFRSRQGSGFRRWNIGTANYNPDSIQIGYFDNQNNPHYGVGVNGWTYDSYARFVIRTGYSEARGSMRSPIFYDLNNTGYYTDPASTSVMNVVRAQRFAHVDDVSQDDQFGLYFGSNQSTAYAIFREGGAWSNPYPDLRIAFHTGIKFGANASYQGMRFYTDYNMATQVMSINNGSDPLGGSNVYVNNSLQAGSSLRAPIFYDSNNTGYYVDPASASHMNTLTLRGNRLGFVNTSFDAEIRVSDANPDGTGADFVLWGDQVQYNARLITEVVHATRHMRAPIYYDANNAGYYLHPDGVSILNDVRATIFYDRNNTGYYADPASTSRFNAINVNNIKDEASPDYGGVYFDTRNGSYELSSSSTSYRSQKIGTGLAIYSGYSTGANRPFTYDMSAQFNLSGIAFEIAVDWVQGDRTPMKVRSLRDCCIGWSNWTDIATSGVSFTNNQDLRAPIFYDSNDTSYYADPNGFSRFNTMQFVGDVNFDGGAGAIELTSSDIRSNGNSNWTGNPGSGVGKIQMHSNRWYIVSNGNSNRIVQFRQNGSDRSYIANDGRLHGVGGTASQDWRAPIFYDNNDTGYYLDPNSTSNSALRIRGGALHGPNPSWGEYLAVGTNGHWSSSYASVATTNGNLHLDSRSGRDLYLQWYVGRTVYVSGAIQATIYYDRNNTSYYADMASTSYFNDFRANIMYERENTAYYFGGSQGDASMRTVTVDRLNMRDRGDFITFYGNDSDYHSISSRDNGGGVTDDLRFNSYHDIFFNLDSNNNNSTGSTGFYVGQHGAATGSISGWAFQAMADGNSYSNTSFRTYTFYAREDTGYYMDPNGTSRLRAVYANDWFRADGGSGLYFQDYGYGVRGAQAEGNSYGNISTYGTGRNGWSGYGIDRKWAIMSSGTGNSNNFGVHNNDSSWLWYWNGSYTNTRLGYLQNESDMRAPVFYDSNNTGYYFNGASINSTRFEGVSNRTKAHMMISGQTRSSAEYYGARPRITSDQNYWTGSVGWGRIDMNTVANWGSGFFDSWSSPPNQPSGTSHWVGVQAYHYTNGSARYGWQLAGGPITNLRFRSTWSGFRTWRTVPVLDENSGNGGGMYAGVYYDANDSGYYLDPNSTSNQALRVRGGILHGPNTSWGQYLYVGGNGHWTSSYASVVATNGNLHIDPQSGDHLYFNYYVNGQAKFYNGSGAERFRVDTNGIVYSFSQHRSPIYYDYNNTGYYTDPASTSQFNVTAANRYAFRGTGGNSGQSIGNAYELFQTSGGWSYPYPALRINYHTGIDFGANPSYQGYRFMNDYNSNTVRFQINGGSSYTYKYTWLYTDGGSGMYTGTNGAHFYPNQSTSYGSWNILGNRSGWYGLAFSQPTWDPHLMFDGNGSGGIYLQGGGRWVYYHNRSNNCTGFASSSTVSGYRVRINGSLYCNGNVVAYSDARDKDNIITIDGALDKVLQLRGVYYDRKTRKHLVDDRDEIYKGRQLGMIAQEVKDIVPEVVSYADELDQYGLDYPKMVGLLVEGIKDQHKIVEDQQKLINSQQIKIDKLEEMVYNIMNKMENK